MRLVPESRPYSPADSWIRVEALVSGGSRGRSMMTVSRRARWSACPSTTYHFAAEDRLDATLPCFVVECDSRSMLSCSVARAASRVQPPCRRLAHPAGAAGAGGIGVRWSRRNSTPASPIRSWPAGGSSWRGPRHQLITDFIDNADEMAPTNGAAGVPSRPSCVCSATARSRPCGRRPAGSPMTPTLWTGSNTARTSGAAGRVRLADPRRRRSWSATTRRMEPGASDR